MAVVDSAPWLSIEIERTALTENLKVFRDIVGSKTRLLAVVKADAYGHGLLLASESFLAAGADLLGVHSLAELRRLRAGGIGGPVLVLGPLLEHELSEAIECGAEVTVASLAALEAAQTFAETAASDVLVHLKVETGVNRQGIIEAELERALEILQEKPRLRLVGLSSHFADVEDTTDHAFALQQMERFEFFDRAIAAAGFQNVSRHMSCSASVLLWDRSQRDLARVGVSAYGIWPSRETLVALRERGRQEVVLRPAMTWKVRVAQVREVPAGETVGYGRTWQALADSRIAVLPVGFADGWLRGLSGRAHVLLHGRRAPLVGRICMNLCMVDVTHIPEVVSGDAAVLLGRQGDEEITAEDLARHLGTIPYEILTLPGDTWDRVPV